MVREIHMIVWMVLQPFGSTIQLQTTVYLFANLVIPCTSEEKTTVAPSISVRITIKVSRSTSGSS
jgi:hypothetical protein